MKYYKQRLKNYIKIVILLYCILVISFILFQRKLLYQPYTGSISKEYSDKYNLNKIHLKTNDNVKLEAWYRAPKKNQSVIVFFHGKSRSLAIIEHLEKIKSFLLNSDYGFLFLHFRGYGHSAGSPTEKGLYIDAQTAINYLEKEQKIDLSNIILYGESLGTGVAIEMAVRSPNLKFIILEAPYISVMFRAKAKYSFIPIFKQLIWDKFDNGAKISKVFTPVLIIHGTADKTVPITDAMYLYNNLPQKIQKKFIKKEGKGHVSGLDFVRIIQDVAEFDKEITLDY